MADLHDYHLCTAHGRAKQEVQHFHAPALSFSPDPKKAANPKFVPADNIFSEPEIPDPGLFMSFILPSSEDASKRLPTVSECAAHLELLEAIYHLKADVIYTRRLDDVLGMPQASKKVWRKKQVRGAHRHMQTEILEDEYKERAPDKWMLFLSLAVLRFELWASKTEEKLRQSESVAPTLPYLPPLGKTKF